MKSFTLIKADRAANIDKLEQHGQAAGMHWWARCRTSGSGYKETSNGPKSTSALPPKADILVAVTDFRL